MTQFQSDHETKTAIRTDAADRSNGMTLAELAGHIEAAKDAGYRPDGFTSVVRVRTGIRGQIQSITTEIIRPRVTWQYRGGDGKSDPGEPGVRPADRDAADPRY